MAAQFIGAHMPTGKGLFDAVRRGKEIGCTAVQVFTSSPQQWKSKPVTPEAVDLLKQAVEETELDWQNLISHDSYLINLCAPDPAKREMSIKGLTAEINRCATYGIPYVVSHMGAHMGEGIEAGIKAVAEATKEILAETDDTVTILMETTAGQGSSLNSKFEEIAEILSQTGNPQRLAVCLDTCHIFAAGYDIRTEEAYNATFEEFDRLIGCERIKVIHCNDSKKELGTRVDRHAHLGEGFIGNTAFKCLVNDPRFERTPIVVETPEAETMHAVNVQKLWEWCN
ncbi:deoxyribonuclease IV [Kamptonema cortianum]|nr:deoxyribonuclease IV [Geitlerinema splendidum]MDK3160957.1 deoxyribonuclease IV [Kamptonema cortianum]